MGYMCFFFFFFKQKTAYEMRISDWSSDVCSSDLALDDHAAQFDSKGIQIPQLAIYLGKMFAGDRVHGVAGDVFLVGELKKLLNLFNRKAQRAKIGRASCRERVYQYV